MVKKLNVPVFRYAKNRWNSIKNLTSREIVDHWNDNPDRVAILTNTEFGANPMILLTMEQFADIIEVVMEAVTAQEWESIKRKIELPDLDEKETSEDLN